MHLVVLPAPATACGGPGPLLVRPVYIVRASGDVQYLPGVDPRPARLLPPTISIVHVRVAPPRARAPARLRAPRRGRTQGGR